jgi:hypothetical protein
VSPFAVVRVENEAEVEALRSGGLSVLLRATEGEELLLLLGPGESVPRSSAGLLRLLAETLNSERRSRGAAGWARMLARADRAARAKP